MVDLLVELKAVHWAAMMAVAKVVRRADPTDVMWALPAAAHLAEHSAEMKALMSASEPAGWTGDR